MCRAEVYSDSKDGSTTFCFVFSLSSSKCPVDFRGMRREKVWLERAPRVILIAPLPQLGAHVLEASHSTW